MTMTSNPNPELRVPIVMDRAGVPEDADIQAIPLDKVDWADVKPKNAGIALRWINHHFNNGLRYQQALYQGYTNATPPDVKDCPTSYFKDGKVINGDLILMKIDDKKYRGALKYRREQAQARVDPTSLRDRQQAHTVEALKESGAGNAAVAAAASKIRVEAPNSAELERLVGKDTGVKVPNPKG